MAWGTAYWTAEFAVVTLRAGVVALAVSLVLGTALHHAARLAQARQARVRRGPLAGLGPAERLAVAHAVGHGERVGDARLAPAAVELARQRQRLTKVLPVLGIVVLVNLGLQAFGPRSGAALRQAVVFALFSLVAASHQAGVDGRARRAEEVNAGAQLR
jgi:hypothetical protein